MYAKTGSPARSVRSITGWNPDLDFAIQDKRKGCYIPVQISDDSTPTTVAATSERDTPYQSDNANTLGACPESVKGEVYVFYHPSPLSDGSSSQRKWAPSTWDWLTRTFRRRRSSLPTFTETYTSRCTTTPVTLC